MGAYIPETPPKWQEMLVEIFTRWVPDRLTPYCQYQCPVYSCPLKGTGPDNTVIPIAGSGRRYPLHWYHKSSFSECWVAVEPKCSVDSSNPIFSDLEEIGKKCNVEVFNIRE